MRCCYKAGAECFRQDELIPGPARRIRIDAVRVNRAGHGITKLDLRITDGVAAENHGPGSVKPLRSPLENLAEPLEGFFVVRIADQIEPGSGRPPHRVDIAQRVGGRNLAVDIGIVHHRGEEIDGLDDSQLVRQPVDACVVVRFRTDEDVGIGDLG